MEASSAHSERRYWLLVAVVLPAANWWVGLWVLVLARDAVPLLAVAAALLALESVAVAGRRRGDHPAPSRLGTLGLLLINTLAWSFALTLGALALQQNVFTF